VLLLLDMATKPIFPSCSGVVVVSHSQSVSRGELTPSAKMVTKDDIGLVDWVLQSILIEALRMVFLETTKVDEAG